MTTKYYQFDYAEMNGIEIKNIGILNFQSSTSISKALLMDYARKYLKDPHANIVISNITKISKAEFEQMKGNSI